MNRDNRYAKLLAVFFAAVLLAACAAEVKGQKTRLTPVSAGTGRVIELIESVELAPPTGYRRTLAAGSQWREVGRAQEGTVFRPVNGVLTAEGANVYEAYIVLDGDRIVGFYLPTEQAFSALPPKPVKYQNKGKQE